eukprot:TRINITY_DN6188_c0_g1_i13.p1 TRINITY_DN6188_c0_g1~~TRINITY_DN6188_c0_g1_i13.p1  ORF type:complete len:554 (+),score=129.00 TRINITY_DN6188_c0_g1_i13:38-1663(+)
MIRRPPRSTPLYSSAASDVYKRQVKKLCYTFAMNRCPYLIITEKSQDLLKPVIVITARVHPGESNSSYVVEGFIGFLLSSDYRAASLRRMFVFYVIPMLNPDGVVYGNYRCSLAGVDLNRNWISPSKILHPTIYYAKELVRGLVQSGRKVMSFCDFHGHFSTKDIFLLGCHSKVNDSDYQDKSRRIRMLAKILARVLKNFSLPNSKFAIEKTKLSTGRVVVYREFDVVQSYTLETSCYESTQIRSHYDLSSKSTKHVEQFKIKDFKEIGQNVAIAYFIQESISKKSLTERTSCSKNLKQLLRHNRQPDLEYKTSARAVQGEDKTLSETAKMNLRSAKLNAGGARGGNKQGNRGEDEFPVIRKQISTVFVRYDMPIVKFICKEDKANVTKKKLNRAQYLVKETKTSLLPENNADAKPLKLPWNCINNDNNKKEDGMEKRKMMLDKYVKVFNPDKMQINTRSYSIKPLRYKKHLYSKMQPVNGAATDKEFSKNYIIQLNTLKKRNARQEGFIRTAKESLLFGNSKLHLTDSGNIISRKNNFLS